MKISIENDVDLIFWKNGRINLEKRKKKNV